MPSLRIYWCIQLGEISHGKRQEWESIFARRHRKCERGSKGGPNSRILNGVEQGAYGNEWL